MIIYKSYLLNELILTDSNRTSLNLSNNFPSLYLRLDNFPKNDTKVVVLFCPLEKSIVNFSYVYACPNIKFIILNSEIFVVSH